MTEKAVNIAAKIPTFLSNAALPSKATPTMVPKSARAYKARASTLMS